MADPYDNQRSPFYITSRNDAAEINHLMDLDLADLESSWSLDQLSSSFPISPFCIPSPDQPFSPLGAFSAADDGDDRACVDGRVKQVASISAAPRFLART